MYSISIVTAGVESILHDSDPSEDTHKVISPRLEMEANRAGSLEFDIYPNNALYSSVTNPLAEFVVTESYDGTDTEIWRGRLYSTKAGFYNNIHVVTEGELAYLRDIVQEPAKFEAATPKEFATALLKVYNKKAPADKKFYLGRVTLTDDHTSDKITKRVNKGSYSVSYTDNTMDALINMVTNLGGHVELRHENGKRYIDILKDYEHTCAQTINFGENLLDFTSTFTLADLVTCLVPIGGSVSTTNEATGESETVNIDVRSVNNNSPYVLSDTAVATYGRREGTITFSGIIDPSNLLKLGKKWLSEKQFDKAVIAINAVDAAYYSDSTEPLRFLYNVRAISAPHGMNRLFPITKVSLTLDDPKNCMYTMSSDAGGSPSMSTAITDHDKETQQYLSDLSDDLDNTKTDLAKYTASEAGVAEDWLFGSCFIFYPTDERKIKFLEHNEYLVAVYEANKDMLVTERQDFLSAGTGITVTTGWRSSLAPESNPDEYKMTIRGLWPENPNPKPWSVGVYTAGSVTFENGYTDPTGADIDSSLGIIPLYNPSWRTDDAWVVYVVAKFDSGTGASFGRVSVLDGGQAIANDESNGTLTFISYSSSTTPTVSGSALNIADKWMVYAITHNVVTDSNRPVSPILIGHSGGLIFTPDDNPGDMLGHAAQYMINYPNGCDEENISTNHSSSYKFIAVENAAKGQITMDAVYDNVNYLLNVYVDEVTS